MKREKGSDSEDEGRQPKTAVSRGDQHPSATRLFSPRRQVGVVLLAVCVCIVSLFCMFLLGTADDPRLTMCILHPDVCDATLTQGVEERTKTKTNDNHTTARTTLLAAGLDGSEAFGVEDGGGVFRRYKDGSVAPSLQIVRENGYEWIRLRIMVDPDGKYGLFQDLDYVLRMARQAKLIGGFKFLLDFHYSHWWADGDNQWSPDRWRFPGNDTTVEMQTLCTNVFDYTKGVMLVLQVENVLPDAVQIGNEISSGMLWDHGKLPKHWVQDHGNGTLPKEWYNLKDLIQSGIDAIDAVVTKPDERPLIVIHLDTGGDKAYTELWLKTYFSLNGTCDVIGLSWYPMWHGTFDDLSANIDNLSDKFPKQQVWVVETAYYYEGYCGQDDADCKKKLKYPQTEQGQYDFLRALRETLLKTKCSAVFYWGSHWSQPDKWFRASESWEDAERRALFDRTGRALKGIQGLVGL